MDLKEFETKVCGHCKERLFVSAFGVCRSRKDGLNFYCKVCVRAKIYKGRADKRATVRAAREVARRTNGESEARSYKPRILPTPDKPYFITSIKVPVVDRVREAIHRGCRTYNEIWKAVANSNTQKDDVGNALAELMLDSREVRTEMNFNTRLYFLQEIEEPVVKSPTRESPPYHSFLLKVNAPLVKGARF